MARSFAVISTSNMLKKINFKTKWPVYNIILVNLVTTSGTPADAELASAWAALRFFFTEKSSIDTILVLYYS